MGMLVGGGGSERESHETAPTTSPRRISTPSRPASPASDPDIGDQLSDA